MIILNRKTPLSHYQKQIGKDYSLFRKLLMTGNGSAKIFYLSGIEAFKNQDENNSLPYCNMQLYPKGILIRQQINNNVQRVILLRKEIKNLQLTSRRISIPTRFGRKIVHDGEIEITYCKHPPILLYTSVTFYPQIKNFFQKDWLKKKTCFLIDPTPPIFGR